MCGFVGLFDIRRKSDALRGQVLKMSKQIRHRGPDWSGVYCGERAILSHERLSIVDPQSGGQPLFSCDGKQVLAVNGEIYNHQEIRAELAGEYDFQTGSDCEVILPLYRKLGVGLLEKISGIFAFALYDIEKDEYLIARDPVGVIPLYIGWDSDEQFYVASEQKALEGVCSTSRPFLPGHYWSSREGKMVRWYKRDWFEYDAVKDNGADIQALREALESAVKRQLMSDVPYGVLLSGGLDSSIISAVAKKYADRRVESNDRDRAWWPQLHSFAIGLKGAPDLTAARKVADHIGTVHHEINYTVQEGLDAVRDVSYYIETYDVTTVRASRFSAATSISTRLPTPVPSTRRPCARSVSCTSTTACAPTSRSRHGVSRGACRSSTKSSSTWRCASTRRRKWPRTGISKNGSCARRSRTCSPPRSYGVRKNSSPTA